MPLQVVIFNEEYKITELDDIMGVPEITRYKWKDEWVHGLYWDSRKGGGGLSALRADFMILKESLIPYPPPPHHDWWDPNPPEPDYGYVPQWILDNREELDIRDQFTTVEGEEEDPVEDDEDNGSDEETTISQLKEEINNLKEENTYLRRASDTLLFNNGEL